VQPTKAPYGPIHNQQPTMTFMKAEAGADCHTAAETGPITR